MNAHEWDKLYRARDLVWSTGPNQFVERELASLPPGRAVDLACGEGRNAMWLAERGWQTTGVDFSAAAIDKARRLAARRQVDVTWRVADVVRDPPEPRSVDLVVLAYLHLPWPSMAAVLRAGGDALDAGGTLLVVGHDLSNLRDGHGGPPDAAVLYTADQLTSALPDLDIERATTVRREVATDDGPRDAIDVLVRAHRPR